MVVCQYCRATVYWDEESALKLGAQSILPEADTRLYLHATGRLLGRGFTVEGHLRYDHGRGTWDEWYLQLEDGSVAWLSESERQLTLEQATRADAPIAAPSQLRVGQPIGLDQRPYTIRELGTATCIGGEGQLPFAVLPGSRYAYADLASLDGLRFASVEFEQGDRPACFVGHVLQHDQLALDLARPPSKEGARSGRDIRCTNCRASLQVPENRPVQTKVCEYCGAVNPSGTAKCSSCGSGRLTPRESRVEL